MKILLVSDQDHLCLAAAQSVRAYYEQGFCISLGVPSAELATYCESHGYSVLSTKDVSLAEAAASEFSPDVILQIGKTSLGLPQKTINVVLGSEKIPGAEDPPIEWPEFVALYQGATEMKLDFLEGEETILSAAIPILDQDTAISLRFKAVGVLPNLINRLCTTVFALERLPESCDEGDDNSVLVPANLPPAETERFVRAMLFPPHECAIVKNQAGESFYVDSYPQYLAFQKTQTSETQANGLQEQFAADTHWYSNVGGTIVRVQEETVALRRKGSAAKVIPGQALGKQAKKRLRMNEPLIGLNANIYISQALSSGWIGVEGPHIKKFEASLARICGVQAACAVQSGTAALYGAMKALGVSDQMHHVVVPTYTCAACADAIVHAGGIPIAVDCELDSYGLSYEAVKQAIDENPNIVGVVIAPCYGVPSRDHLKIFDLCRDQGLWLCEDNCESYGAVMDIEGWSAEGFSVGQQAKVGSLSTMCVVSVRSEKMVGVGEGGAILSHDAALVSKARWWCSRAPVRGCGLWRVYEHEAIGQNFRLPELLGAVGLAACENLPVMIERKREISSWYKEGLQDIPGLEFQKAKNLDEPVWWLNSLRLTQDRPTSTSNFAEAVGTALMKSYPHIEIRPAFYPLHKICTFADAARPCPNADKVYDTLLCVPSSAKLERDDVMEVCAAFKEAYSMIAASE